VLLQLRLHECERQRRRVDRTVDERHDVRHAADVILVPVRQDEGGGAPFLLQVREIGDHPIDAEQLGIRKHDAGVDHDCRVAPGEREHVHAELAEASERNDFEHVIAIPERRTADAQRKALRSWRSVRSRLAGDTPSGAEPAKGAAMAARQAAGCACSPIGRDGGGPAKAGHYRDLRQKL
jgi:hypothetical protein